MDVPKVSGTRSDFSFLSPLFLNSLASIGSRREKLGVHVPCASPKAAMGFEDQTKLFCGRTCRPNPHGPLLQNAGETLARLPPAHHTCSHSIQLGGEQKNGAPRHPCAPFALIGLSARRGMFGSLSRPGFSEDPEVCCIRLPRYHLQDTLHLNRNL